MVIHTLSFTENLILRVFLLRIQETFLFYVHQKWTIKLEAGFDKPGNVRFDMCFLFLIRFMIPRGWITFKTPSGMKLRYCVIFYRFHQFYKQVSE